ncbi:MAG: PQQ-dependent sugar dehydrogenase [Alphaproteobacteria bacterium]
MNDPAAKPSPPRRRRLAMVAAALIGLGVILLGAFGLGYFGGEIHAIEKINQKYLQPALHSFRGPTDQETVTWDTINTHFYPLQVARIDLSPGGSPAVWALEEIDGDILYATRLGQFGYLDPQYHLHRLNGLQVQMGVDELTRTPLFRDPIFQLDQVRTLDLLTIKTGANTYDLYVSHHRYRNGCFELVVSRAQITHDAQGLHFSSPNWEDLYVTNPCIPVKSIGMRFAGHEGGGRLVRLNADTLLLSIGTYQFDGIDGPFQAGQDDANDMGKIIAISISTHRHSTYARGLRNPQGLVVAKDGRVWETEHGPRGGDEVNLIRRGLNYGWPIVTYGTQYGGKPWPYNLHPGQHLGFERPRFAFVPSIGISNIIQPSDKEFPEWSTHLLAASLVGNSIFALKTEGDDIVYAEPIPLGDRLRDMISLSDGRIAIITDGGILMLLRNGARHVGEPDSFVVSGLLNRPQLQPAETIPVSEDVKGTRIFFYYCGSCHTTTGEAQAGPPLNGVLGRDIGSVPGFPYSSALTHASGRWTPSRLRSFLNRDDPAFEGSAMPPVSLYKDQFEALITYLKTTRPTPSTEQQRGH